MPGLMTHLSLSSSFARMFQTSINHFYRREEPERDVANDDWKYPQSKPLLHVPKPPVDGCPINSLPPEILSAIFIIGQQMDLDPEPSRYASEPAPDPDDEQNDPAHVRGNLIGHPLPGVDKALPPAPVLEVDDDHENSDWEDEDSEHDDYSGASSTTSILIDGSFQVTVSHVCKHWREVALETPTLWSDIDLETGTHAAHSYSRASAYLSRSKMHPLSICIDVEEEDNGSDDSDHCCDQSPTTMHAQLQQFMDLLIPHTSRWRKFKLVAEDYLYFHTVLNRLSDAPPASLLEDLELHHYDDESEPEDLPFPHPNLKTPFVLFDNHAPKLQYVSLCGVHIDWHKTTFLKGLHYFELAYHSQDVRPSFDEFFTILRSSPGLRTLDLCMSGPFGPPQEWPAFLPPPPQDDHYHDPHVPASFNTRPRTLDEHMILPKLHELKLADQSPEELAAFFNRVSMPTLHTLELNFEDHEYSNFVQNYLIAPPKWQGNTSSESRLTNLKELRIIQLPCKPRVVAELYAALANLETIDLNFNTLDDPFWEIFIPSRVEGVTIPARQLLPALQTMRVKGSRGEVLRRIVTARLSVGLPLKMLCIDFGTELDEDEDRWLREHVKGVEYFEDSDEGEYSDDETGSTIIEVDMDDGF